MAGFFYKQNSGEKNASKSKQKLPK